MIESDDKGSSCITHVSWPPGIDERRGYTKRGVGAGSVADSRAEVVGMEISVSAVSSRVFPWDSTLGLRMRLLQR